MKAQRRQFPRHTPRRRWVWAAWLVVCVLLGHSFDTCAAHLGLQPVRAIAATDAPQIAAPCPNGNAATCQICTARERPHNDGCNALTEIAVFNSSQHQIEQQAVVLTATLAVVPAMPQLIALSGCLHGRAGPPPALPASVYLRSSLPARAPPRSV